LTHTFQTDGKGNIIIRPVVGWTTHKLAEVAILLSVQYVETEEGLHTGYSQTIQLGLTPALCLDLAESLTKAAKGILDESTPPGTPLQ
jgi:hypothetical protein